MKSLFTTVFLYFIVYSTSAQIVFGGESVEYDSTGQRFFTSSDNTSIIQRASDGTLSYFGNGLMADYGMEIMGNTLFAITGSTVRGYDLTTEIQVMSASVPGSNFLNGLTNDGNGNLYVTGYSSHKIFKIDVTNFAMPVVTTIVSNTVTAPNGIIYDGANNRLIFVNWGTNAPIKAVNLSTNAVSTITTTTLGNCDGIDDDNYGNYYVSSWSPARITRFNAAFTGMPVTITAPGINSPADIGYAKAIDTLAVPNGNNTVTFIGFAPVGIAEKSNLDFNVSLSPNPVTENSHFSFELKATSNVLLLIYDESGKQIHQLIDEKLSVGKHYVLLSGIDLPKGNYLYRLLVDNESVSGKFVK